MREPVILLFLLGTILAVPSSSINTTNSSFEEVSTSTLPEEVSFKYGSSTSLNSSSGEMGTSAVYEDSSGLSTYSNASDSSPSESSSAVSGELSSKPSSGSSTSLNTSDRSFEMLGTLALSEEFSSKTSFGSLNTSDSSSGEMSTAVSEELSSKLVSEDASSTPIKTYSVCDQCDCIHEGILTNLTYYNVSCTARGILEIPYSMKLPLFIDVLDLSHNYLTDSNITPRGRRIRVMNLILKRNQIGKIAEPDFYGVEGVGTLDLSLNRIIDIIGRPFMFLKGLKVLDLSGNRLREIPDNTFRSLTILQTLNLSHNPLHTLTSATVSNLPSLLHLDLSYSALSAIHRYSFKGCENLQVLDLSWNQLETIPTGAFHYIEQLEHLKLTGNLVRILDQRSFWFPENLIGIDLDQMPELRAVRTKTFSRQKALIRVNISNNKRLDTVDASAFKDAHTLSSIDLSRNQLLNIENSEELLVFCDDSDVMLYGNPWECDCKLKWMLSCLSSSNLSSVRCQHPLSKEGTPVSLLSEDQLECDDDIYLIGLGFISKKVGIALLCLGIVGVLCCCCGIILMCKIRPRIAWNRRVKDKNEDVYYVRMKDCDPDEPPIRKY